MQRTVRTTPPTASALALIVCLSVAGTASAEVPLGAFPGCGDSQDLSSCPWESDNWTFFNFTPEVVAGQIRPEELELGIGNAVLPAWQHGTGRWQSIIAVADSGIMWQESDLVNKVFLNVGELPLPQDADGVEAATHDLDGNGLVNLRDYADDPRVAWDAGDHRSLHMLDPSDLIHTFSDDVDDDDNGYVDDIAGWDFFEMDNDPFATNEDAYGDHGTGVARNAGGEGMDGGRIGVCPNCAILPLRIGDSFITTGPIVADAIGFALTHDATAMAAALGGMSSPPILKELMERAWAEGLVVVAAAGDETSLHRNQPATLEHALSVHSISGDHREWEEATSFLRFVNCNNFGPRVELVAATRNSCATGAVAYIAGAIGLLDSFGHQYLDEPLSAPELYQLVTMTATDIDLPESRGPDADPELFPSYPGWDQDFGYGRLNLAAAADAVVAGEIPPVATIESPDWFEYIDRLRFDDHGELHGATSTVRVEGVASAERAASFTWRLEWGVGSDVPADGWRPAGDGGGQGSFEGLLGEVAVGEVLLAAAEGCDGVAETDDPLAGTGFDPSYTCPPLERRDGILGRTAKLDPYGISLRLTVTDDQGRVGRHRRHIYVRQDEALLPGFPVRLASGESSPALADLDGDGVFEIIQADTGGVVHVLDGTGNELPGWPQAVSLAPPWNPDDPRNHLAATGHQGLTSPGRQNLAASVAVGALDGAGPPDVVAATLNGEMWAWRADGTVRPGFPVAMDYENCDPALRDNSHRYDCGFFATPTLADLDGDGRLEILQPGMDQFLYIWQADGTPLPGWPLKVQDPDFAAIADREGRILSSPAVGDIDGDGDLDLVLGTSQTAGSEFGGYGMLYALDVDGSIHDGWPMTLFAGFAGALPYIGEGVVVSPALADLDGDGDLEIAANAIADQGGIFHHDGTVAVDFIAINDGFGASSNTDELAVLMMAANGAFADADGDGTPDYFVGGSGIGYGGNILAWASLFDHDHVLLGYSGRADANGRGAALPGFPQQMEDIQFFTSPISADLDGDGDNEVIAGSTQTLRAFDANGSQPLGFPLFTGGWLLGSPAIGDVNGDGLLDVVALTREGYLFAWSTQARADTNVEWAMFGHDARRTGNYHTPLPPQVGPEEPGEGCELSGPSPSEPTAVGAGLGLVLLLGARRRRGRRR